MRILAAAGILVIVAAAMSSYAAAQDFAREAALAESQAAIGRSLGDHAFRDVDGQPFQLQDLSGKPLVISLIYTSCHHVCPLITQHVADSVDIAQEALGEDAFNVVTVGFDWQVDTPEQMRRYQSSRDIDAPGWYFLSGDATSIAALTRDVGFQFYPSAKGFDHLTQTTIVAASGRIYRQVYGMDFKPPAFVEPLKELVFETPRDAGLVEHWVDTFKLFCTVYDPNSGRYDFDYSIFMTILIGTLCLGALLAFIVREWRHAR